MPLSFKGRGPSQVLETQSTKLGPSAAPASSVTSHRGAGAFI